MDETMKELQRFSPIKRQHTANSNESIVANVINQPWLSMAALPSSVSSTSSFFLSIADVTSSVNRTTTMTTIQKPEEVPWGVQEHGKRILIAAVSRLE